MNLPQFSENQPRPGKKIPEMARFFGTPAESRASLRLSSRKPSCALSGAVSQDSCRILPVIHGLTPVFPPFDTAMPSSPNSPSSDLPETLLQLISADMDGELSAAEKLELQAQEAAHPEKVAAIRQRFTAVQTGLKSLPVAPLPGLLFQTPKATVPQSARRRGQVAVVSVITAMVLGLMVMVRLLGRTGEPAEGMTMASAGATAERSAAPMVADSRAADSMVIGPMAADSKTAADEELLAARTNVQAPAMSARQSATASAAAGPGAESPGAHMEQTAAEAPNGTQRLRELLDAGKWNVVVLRVSEAQHQTAVQKVESVCQEHGLSLTARPVQGNESVERMGFVLTSSEAAEQNAIVAELEKALGVEAVTDPERSLTEMSREEIARIVRQSLESPTQAELFEGDLYIATPDHSELVAAAEALLQSDAKQKNAAAAAAAANHADVANELTLLVLEFPMPEAI